ncbi:MAG: hypothetical protein HRS50_00490 [Mycoplasmataceae bacterium]|nr:hypothetical protein [Mycoplasmataceae bacterium]
MGLEIQISLIIAIASVITAIIAAIFSYKSYRINQQRYIVQALQLERKAWLNRIKHFIKHNVEHLDWTDKRFLKKDKIIIKEKEVSTWDSLAKHKFYEITDLAISKHFNGKETMTEMIEKVFERRLKDSYWIQKKNNKLKK